MLVKNAIMFTTTEEDFNRILNDLNTKLQFLKANDFEYYSKAIEAWKNEINELLLDKTIPESTRIRLGSLLEIINR